MQSRADDACYAAGQQGGVSDNHTRSAFVGVQFIALSSNRAYVPKAVVYILNRGCTWFLWIPVLTQACVGRPLVGTPAPHRCRLAVRPGFGCLLGAAPHAHSRCIARCACELQTNIKLGPLYILMQVHAVLTRILGLAFCGVKLLMPITTDTRQGSCKQHTDADQGRLTWAAMPILGRHLATPCTNNAKHKLNAPM